MVGYSHSCKIVEKNVVSGSVPMMEGGGKSYLFGNHILE
jgi:hypothetical protein